MVRGEGVFKKRKFLGKGKGSGGSIRKEGGIVVKEGPGVAGRA